MLNTLIRRGREALLAALATLASAVMLASGAIAQQPQFPAQIKIVVPFAAGASTDLAARAVAAELTRRTGSVVIVEAMPGASTYIGAAAVAKAPKDGSVILMTSSSTFTAAATKATVTMDVNTELLPVALLSEGPITIAASLDSNIRTTAELIAAARAKPDMVTHGMGGIGTFSHVVGELFCEAAGIQIKHVPYKGAALAVNDFIAGRIDVMIGTYTTVAPQVKAGRARLVAVTSLQPHPAFPGIPTVASVVPGFSAELWVGFFAPAGTPPAVVQRLNRELNEVADSAAVREAIAPDGALPRAISPDQFASKVRNSYVAWKKLAKEKNIVVD